MLDLDGLSGRSMALVFPAGHAARSMIKVRDDGETDDNQNPTELDRRYRALLCGQKERADDDRKNDGPEI